ncbi:Predicted arabinose efflux permease, MFS family [Roseomonas rosea]|uniref:Predicted arabinose efflux permease, MFS family n=1 Tax=Muricoccus roseus TaxID=198092 RepID=A0A1M6IIU1_9PROT|nr:MFS transporter [Roseomonas rosea]SHJ34381.1 Predicted arabinose efflux permease, MFS family [Roseomonas rosea]
MSATTADLATDTAMRRNVRLLFFCQALMNSAVVGQATMGALIGYSLAENKSLATLPMALQMLATMGASIPAGFVFARLGRRPGFLLGAMGSFLGSLTFAYGVWQGSFLIYCLGAIPAGLGFGIAQHYRFAAAELATPAYRPRAIALVMAGGVMAAALGPELVKHSKDLLPPFLFLGTYLFLALMPLICMALLSIAVLPPAPPRAAVNTPVMEIVARPAFLTAALTAAVAYGVMNLLMTSTPLEMMLCGFGVSASATVIQAHAVSMFAPGFFTGRLIARFGARPVILAGVLLNAACVGLALLGKEFMHFTVALVALGLGWNFMFTGATTLLAEAHSAAERVRAQTANDFIVFGTVACTAFGSGLLHATSGWYMLNLMVLPALVFALWRVTRPPAPAA